MGKKILLADDSITIQKVIELTFSDEDFEVVTVGNGRLAIEKVQEVRPDVVLCDIIMPEKDGYEVCEFIKKQPSLSQIPVLLLTGAFEPFDQERAARVGCDGFLAKPFEPQTLIAKVKDLLSQAVARPAPPPAPPTPVPSTPSPGISDLPANLTRPATRRLAQEPEPSMTYIPEEPALEPPMGFADVMDTTHEAPAETYDEPTLDPDAFGEPAAPVPDEDLLGVSPEEEASLKPAPQPADSSATVMFQAVGAPRAGSPSELPEPTAPAPLEGGFEEVFEEDLSPLPASEAPPFVDTEASVPQAAFEAPAQPASEREPPAPALAAELDEPAPEVGEEPIAAASFADISGPGPAPAAAPSEAAEVPVPVEQVAQIAQRVVGQISEKVIREIAWEVIPDLAEALIRKEIERLKAELQQT